MKDRSRLAEILNKQLGLPSYESQAYISLMLHGPMSPSELAQKTGIPRPRAYDVLRGLIEKGLLMEQSGKPPIYTAIEPRQGLKNLLTRMEREASRELEERKEAATTLTSLLSGIYEKSKRFKAKRSKVWFTQRDTAFISIYSEAIRNCKKEFLVASTSLCIPEKEILEAIKYALENGKTVRVVRQITDSWTLEELEKYEEVMKAGSQVRYIEVKDIPFRFMLFDESDVILVFPPEPDLTTPQNIEALWLRMPPLARILDDCFEELWKRGKPMSPILTEIKKRKLMQRTNTDITA